MRNAVQTVALELDHLRDEGLPYGQRFFVGGDLQAHLFYHLLGELADTLSFVFSLFLTVLVLVI